MYKFILLNNSQNLIASIEIIMINLVYEFTFINFDSLTRLTYWHEMIQQVLTANIIDMLLSFDYRYL